jgi:hypothetical protein
VFSYFRRKRLKKEFEKLVSPDLARMLLESPSDFQTPPYKTEKELDWLLVVVDFGMVDVFSKRVETVCSEAIRLDATIFNIVGSLAVIAVGDFQEWTTERRRDTRRKLVTELRQKLGTEIKIVHGSGRAAVGNFGNDSRFCYSFWIPNWAEALGMLGDVEFGEAKEVG